MIVNETDNFPELIGKMETLTKSLKTVGVSNAMLQVLHLIQMTAVSDFMYSTGRGQAPRPDKLTVRSRNLADAVINQDRQEHVEKIVGTGWKLDGETGVKSSDTLPYAAIHEYGGEITPNTAKMLHFQTWEGDEVFTKKVNMPKRAYMHPARDKVANMPETKVVMEKALQKTITMTGFS